jgi:hypothetical protein
MLTATTLAACVSSGPILATPSDCAGFIPEAWKEPVPGAELPDGNTLADWIVFADQQTAQLDKANGRLRDTLHIVGECERRAAAAVKRPKVLGVF